MKKMKTRNKILISILFIICLFLLKNGNEVNAANYIWPVGGSNYGETYIEYWYKDRNYDSTAYDKKYNYAPYEQTYSAKEYHYGVDITGIKGKKYELVSIANGKVVATSAERWYYAGLNFPDRNKRKSSNDGGGYGNYVVIQESSTGKCFLYAHLKGGSITVKKGDTVKVGQKIGVMGSSGDSGHMHLHFEVRKSLKTTTTSNGGNLVSTTGYNIQTENPVNYIGSAPQVKLNSDSGNKNDTESAPQITVKPAKRTKITYTRYTNYRQINVYFDKAVTVKTAPTITVTVGNETKTAKYTGISKDNKKITYKIEYDQYDMFTSGKMYVKCTGNVIDKTDGKSSVNCTFSNITIGELSAYKINNTFSEIVNNNVGDVNNDGKVSSIDSSIVWTIYIKNAVNQKLTSIEKEYMKKADVNKDGTVDTIDASLILTYYAETSTGLSDENAKKIIKCDISGDQTVTVKDYNLLQKAVKNGVYNEKYDLDGNKLVDKYDLLYFRSVLKDNGNR